MWGGGWLNLSQSIPTFIPVPTATASQVVIGYIPWVDSAGIVYESVYATTSSTALSGITLDNPSLFVLSTYSHNITTSTTQWSSRTLYQVIDSTGKYTSATASTARLFFVTETSSFTLLTYWVDEEQQFSSSLIGTQWYTTIPTSVGTHTGDTSTFVSRLTSSSTTTINTLSKITNYTSPSSYSVLNTNGANIQYYTDSYFFNIGDYSQQTGTTSGVNIYYQITAPPGASGLVTDLAFAQTGDFIMEGTDNFDVIQIPANIQTILSWTKTGGSLEFQGLFGPNEGVEGTDTLTQSNLFFVGTFNPSTAEFPFRSIEVATSTWLSSSGQDSNAFHAYFYPGFVLPQYTTWSTVSSFALTTFYPDALMVYPFVDTFRNEGRVSTTTTIVGLAHSLVTANYNSSLRTTTGASGTFQYLTDNRAYFPAPINVNGILGVDVDLRFVPRNKSAIWPNGQYGTDQNDIVYQNMSAEFIGTAFTSLFADPIFIGSNIFSSITSISNENGGFLSKARVNQSSLVFTNSTLMHVKYLSSTDGFITGSSTTLLSFNPETNPESTQPDAMTLSVTAGYSTTTTDTEGVATIYTEQTDELRIRLVEPINTINLVNWNSNWFQAFSLLPDVPLAVYGGNHGAGTFMESVAPFNNLYQKSVTLNGFRTSSTYTTIYSDTLNRNASSLEEVPINSLRFASGGFMSLLLVGVTNNQASDRDWVLFHKYWPYPPHESIFAFSANEKSIYTNYYNGDFL
jgi:hypothetical protein